MANKMLIDATHPEETRVVVVRGNRVEEFDYESASRKQLRGNIYLAKVTRVEPSLQAAFVEYGGNRHGFLAFSEIHPDYYQIPVADRLALIEEEERAARLADEEDERRERRRERSRPRRSASDEAVSGNVEEIEDAEVVETIEDGQISGGDDDEDHDAPVADAVAEPPSDADEAPASDAALAADDEASTDAVIEAAPEAPVDAGVEPPVAPFEATQDAPSAPEALPAPQEQAYGHEAEQAASAPEGEREESPVLNAFTEAAAVETSSDDEDDDSDIEQIEDEEEVVEQLGSGEDALEEVPERMPQRRGRTYKIQEVIRRRQVMLVQVVKEERGNKGAALTTYLSLAGRYSVLMPNTARGGGISRKITNAVDRKRLKEVVQDLEVPEGMGVILRTAGANRTKVEIKRDFEYLLRLWETVRELTLSSSAPSLVYEEGSLIKRAIRDLYNKDIDDIHVAGEEGFKEARDFMRMLMPSHAKNVIAYREPQPIFAKYGVEHQLDAMFSPVVQLKSGGYIVINPTEALVSIDVNSGRATREHHIEDTALKTNLEASEEIARQLRLRDLAGLIVIDFIDMEEKRNNRAVERKLKDCLKNDRARIQVGRISHFGLMEMSRQRIRTGVLESSIEVCPVCGGTGHVRSAASVALQLLRALEEQLLRSTTHNLVARTRGEVALYVLNQKRAHLRELEDRFSVTLIISADESVTGHQPFLIEKGDLAAPAPAAPRSGRVVQPDSILPEEEYEEEDEALEEAEIAEATESAEDSEDSSERGEDGGRRRRRRRRRRGGERDVEAREPRPEGEAAEGEDDAAASDADGDAEGEDGDDEDRSESQNERRRRRRGRRGGRRNRREGEEGALSERGEGEGESNEEGAENGEASSEAEAEAEAPVTYASGAISEVPQADNPAIETATSPAAEAVPPEAATEQASAPVEAAPAPVAEAPVAPAPLTSTPAAEVPAAPETKPTRRRSTVREKAPTLAASSPAEPVASAPTETAPVEAAPVEAAPEVPTPEAPAVAAEPSIDATGADASMPISNADFASGSGVSEGPASEPAPEAAPETKTASPEAASAEETGKRKSGWWQRKLFGE
ncbi:Rne/Rng family ribonuclease [Aquabacter sp. L1I39]|uniref:Rne/Rng family ribonuclease n=1 Tax=Aquabacter sp. L1I39 TaxID=2820278 RepID=UPI001ADC62AC|nr:ribonuclease E/G [Aquabacter sp. L1I39]QTL03521.1 Rne/Rng family ribonuclease [Aquabacter sp. L1I39]